MAFAFCEDRNEHIGTRHFLASRTLDMDRSSLDNALEGRCWRCFDTFDIVVKCIKFCIDEFRQLFAQDIDIDAACFHHTGGFHLVAEREKKMF